MTQFRKKPVVVEAVQFARRFDWPDWFHDAVSACRVTTYGTGKFAPPSEDCFCMIETLEGRMRCSENDWIIRGVAGELYPCKPDIFAKTYEPADAAPEAAEPVAWQVWWGIGKMSPHWPPFKTESDAETHASMIKSMTEVRPLYAGRAPTDSQAGRDAVEAELSAALDGLHAIALDIFDGPETSQDVRDVIEWYASSIRVLTDTALSTTTGRAAE